MNEIVLKVIAFLDDLAARHNINKIEEFTCPFVRDMARVVMWEKV